MSKIPWTDETWNPFRAEDGKWHCAKVSPGCKNCYAETMNTRWGGPPYRRGADRSDLRPDIVTEPFGWKAPRMVFPCSMTDMFLDQHSDEEIAEAFGVMAVCGAGHGPSGIYTGGAAWHGPGGDHKYGPHTFQVLTKRTSRAADLLSSHRFRARVAHYAAMHAVDRRDLGYLRDGILDGTFWPLSNVWIGTSTEDQKRADERIYHLARCVAAIRYLSVEPLLEDIDIRNGRAQRWSVPTAFDSRGHGREWTDPGPHFIGADWVIIGGESGPRSRVCEVDWIRSVVRQCREAEVPVFVKQLGTRASDSVNGIAGKMLKVNRAATPLISTRLTDYKGEDMEEWPTELRIREMPHGV